MRAWKARRRGKVERTSLNGIWLSGIAMVGMIVHSTEMTWYNETCLYR